MRGPHLTPLGRAGRGESKIHKPALDEMGIALYHEVAPHRPDADGPNRGPRSTLGRPGMRGGWKPRRR